jgi:hypothetical protein
MTKRLPSASQLQRALACGLSHALPHDNEETEHARKGTALHRYLELVAYNSNDSKVVDWRSSGEVPEEYFGDCEAIDLESLPPLVDVQKEVAFEYDFLRDTGRVLGFGINRDYSGCSAEGYPGTADVVGYWPNEPGTLVVLDYKTGFARETPAAKVNWQLKMLALSGYRSFSSSRKIQKVKVGIVKTLGRTWIDWAEMDVLDIENAAVVLRKAGPGFLENSTEQSAYVGSQCDYCPAANSCRAHTGFIAKFTEFSLQPGAEERFGSSLTKTNAPVVYGRLRAVEKAVWKAKQQLAAYAQRHPIDLGEGKFYGQVEDTEEEIDPSLAYGILKAEVGPELLQHGLTIEVTKASVERLARATLPPKGKLAATARRLLEALRVGGAVKEKKKTSMKEYIKKEVKDVVQE